MPQHARHRHADTPPAQRRPLALRLAALLALAAVLSFFSLPGWVTLSLLVGTVAAGVVALMSAFVRQ